MPGAFEDVGRMDVPVFVGPWPLGMDSHLQKDGIRSMDGTALVASSGWTPLLRPHQVLPS